MEVLFVFNFLFILFYFIFLCKNGKLGKGQQSSGNKMLTKLPVSLKIQRITGTLRLSNRIVLFLFVLFLIILCKRDIEFVQQKDLILFYLLLFYVKGTLD